ncbi:hypothetical protein CLCR_07814 [Cladophialophora carrionii]|uniref:Uncharacterized protein n=1 Tax=Cladophialophora carrionii TaxID=86049 RepID=A0A1C1CNL3_9EURO|nr:hypothetical protein CLCR_07814 [Cladophialophora carrionii]
MAMADFPLSVGTFLDPCAGLGIGSSVRRARLMCDRSFLRVADAAADFPPPFVDDDHGHDHDNGTYTAVRSPVVHTPSPYTLPLPEII